MAKLLKYMVVHEDPRVSWEKVEENLDKGVFYPYGDRRFFYFYNFNI